MLKTRVVMQEVAEGKVILKRRSKYVCSKPESIGSVRAHAARRDVNGFDGLVAPNLEENQTSRPSFTCFIKGQTDSKKALPPCSPSLLRRRFISTRVELLDNDVPSARPPEVEIYEASEL